MAFHQHRIEMALPKARDLEKVGKPLDAIDVLHTTLTQRRNFRTWSQTLEDLVLMFIDLAARLRWRAYDMRQVILQYRAATQNNMSSFVKVLRRLITLAEKGVGSGLAVAAEQDDDYEEDTPEALSHHAFSSDAKVRKDRQRNNPAVRFLWDAYRVVLEVLRGNLKLQEMYHDVVRTVFALCLKYKRKSEFRKFAQYLRDHVEALPTSAPGPEAEAQAAEMQTQLLRTRLAQLSTASALELWHDTYTCIKDIHDTLTLTLRVGASTLAAQGSAASALLQIYEKLAKFFLGNDNHLYHSFALLRLSKLAAEAPGAIPEPEEGAELSLLNVSATKRLSAAVLSALVTDLYATPARAVAAGADADAEAAADEAGLTFAVATEQNATLASLLGFRPDTMPTRATLFARLAEEGVLAHAEEKVRALYTLLETATSPLRLNAKTQPILDELAKDPVYSVFVPRLRELIAVRVLQRLASVYTVVTVDHLLALVPSEYTWPRLERLILMLVTAGASPGSIGTQSAASLTQVPLQVRVDHRDRVVYFFTDSYEAPQFARQLGTLASALTRVVSQMYPPNPAASAAERKHVFACVRAGLASEAADLAARRDLLSDRRASEERDAAAKEAERVRKAAEDRERRDTEERARQAAKEREIAEEERRRDAEERDAARKKVLAETIAKQVAEVPTELQDLKAAKKVASMAQNLDTVKQDELIEASRKLQLQQKQERERRLTEERKTLDYTTRAVRRHDAEALEATRAEVETAAQAAYEAAKAAHGEKAKAAWTHAIAEKVRLARVEPARASFTETVMAARRAAHAAAMAEYEEKLAAWEAEHRAAQEKRAEEEAARRAEKEAREAEARRVREEQEAAERAEAAKSQLAAGGPGAYVPPSMRKRG